MRDIPDVPLIKGIPYHDLEHGLLSYKKKQLLQIAERQQLPIRKSATKATVVEQLIPVISENAQHFFAQLDAEELQVIANLANGALPDVSDETLLMVQNTIGSGYLFAYVVTNDVTLVLPNEFVSSIKRETNSTEVNGELEKRAIFLRQLKNTQKIYGTYHIHHLVSVWNKYFPQSMTVDEVKKLIETIQ